MRRMKKRHYSFQEKLFLWPGESANWHFLPIPKQDGQRIRKDFASQGNKKVFCFLEEKAWASRRY
jgi:hypothetical protein